MEHSGRLDAKVCLITGGTRGIGLGAARRLAQLGASVVIVGSSEASCTPAVEAIRRAHPGANVDWLAADFSAQREVRALASDFKQRHDRLDVLVNNAGVIMRSFRESPEGVELTFAINHLAPFLLTNQLLDVLQASAPARIVNVTSVAHERAKPDFDTRRLRQRYRPYRAYGISKLANLMFTYELARRLHGTGVTVNAVNPGLVRTSLGRSNGLLLDLAWALTHLRYRSVSIGPDEGAQTIVLLASAPELATTTGEYFFEGKPAKSSSASHDLRAAEQLWSLSERLTELDIKQPEPAG